MQFLYAVNARSRKFVRNGVDYFLMSVLQGHIWRVGYEKGELKGVVFEDVPEALADWDARGIKAYIYSSGSREAQKHIFGNTNFGDLRVYLSGFFDTTIGYAI